MRDEWSFRVGDAAGTVSPGRFLFRYMKWSLLSESGKAADVEWAAESFRT
jgi:hypothetical protein